MKSFKKFLIEVFHPDFVSSITDSGITTHTYENNETGVQSFIHTKGDTAYWGFTVSGKEGIPTDVAPQNVPQELRRARLNTAFEHLAHFAKRNSNIENILYQTNEGERGDKNHSIFQAKWPAYQEKHEIDTNLVRVEKNPLGSPSPQKIINMGYEII